MKLCSNQKKLNCIKFCPSGDYLVIGERNGNMKLFDIQEKRLVSHNTGYNNNPMEIKWINPFVFYSFTKNGLVRRFDIRANFRNNNLVFSSMFGIVSADYCDFNHYFSIGNKDGCLFTVDIRKGKKALNKVKCLRGPLKKIKFNPFRPSLIIAGGGKTGKKIVFANIFTGGILKTINTNNLISDI